MRGTVALEGVAFQLKRFIPAGAGNGRADRSLIFRPAVHPRGCGERCLYAGCIHYFTGSSPRVRGTVCRQKPFARSGRFIPAGAGNGFGAGAYCAFGCGSSPRVRGTVFFYTHVFPRDRFIPAGAGNGTPAVSMRDSIAVHPRGCGERGLRSDSCRWCFGSSPRVRGTVTAILRQIGMSRFIPAGAGNG